MVNQCKDCKSGHTLRIHVITGHRNCERGRHLQSGNCKDYTVRKVGSIRRTRRR